MQKVNKYCLTSIIKNKIVNFSWPRAIFDAKYMNEWTANYCIVYCNIEVNHEWRCFALRRQLLYHSLTHYLFEWHCCGWIISECSQETRCWFDLTLRSLTPLAAALGNNQRMVGAHLFISWWWCEEMPLSFSALVEWNDKKRASLRGTESHSLKSGACVHHYWVWAANDWLWNYSHKRFIAQPAGRPLRTLTIIYKRAAQIYSFAVRIFTSVVQLPLRTK